MQISMEISLYPFTKDYETPILDFIQRLNQHPDLKIQTNAMSTQVQGDYDRVMDVLKKELRDSFDKHGVTISVLKILNQPINL